MTHYQTLGVHETADAEEIRGAFRALARALHPDVSTAKGAGERFALVTAAYEVLSDPARRAEYDRSLAASRRTIDPERAHYSWTNIADSEARAAKGVSDFDELYDTFFSHREDPKP